MNKLHLWGQYFLPRSIIAYCGEKIANAKIVWLKNTLIKRFIKKNKIDLTKVENPDINFYPSFNDFFVRKIKKSAMGEAAHNEIGSPAEAMLREFGTLEDNILLQAKHLTYSLEELLNNEEQLNYFKNGSYLTLFLKPSNYHRYHMPCAGRLESAIYIPHHRTFELDPESENYFPKLFCNNERCLLFFDTAFGKMCLVLVGALYVGSIHLSWMTKPINSRKIVKQKYANLHFEQGDELGCFKHGSTIIVLFEPDKIKWKSKLHKNADVKVNSAIATVIN